MSETDRRSPPPVDWTRSNAPVFRAGPLPGTGSIAASPRPAPRQVQPALTTPRPLAGRPVNLFRDSLVPQAPRSRPAAEPERSAAPAGAQDLTVRPLPPVPPRPSRPLFAEKAAPASAASPVLQAEPVRVAPAAGVAAAPDFAPPPATPRPAERPNGSRLKRIAVPAAAALFALAAVGFLLMRPPAEPVQTPAAPPPLAEGGAVEASAVEAAPAAVLPATAEPAAVRAEPPAEAGSAAPARVASTPLRSEPAPTPVVVPPVPEEPAPVVVVPPIVEAPVETPPADPVPPARTGGTVQDDVVVTRR